jgi:hypothetical protein
MKRIEIIKKLVAEGFSEKTLVNFNDKQLEKLSNKVLKEAQTVTTTKTVYNSKDAKDVAALNVALKNPNINKNDIEVKEEEEVASPKKVKKLDLKNLNEFVDQAVEKNYHSITTKGDIVSLIKEKLNESESDVSERMVPKLPEFMSFDSIVSAGEKEAPGKEAPEVDTPEKDSPSIDRPDRDPRRDPFRNPNEEPAVDPDPKAKVRKLHKSNQMPMAAE